MQAATRSMFAPMLAFLTLITASAPAAADDLDDARRLVVSSVDTLRNFAADPEMRWFRDNLQHANALLIVPEQLRGGLIIGGSGGRGILVARHPVSGQWSSPAFYTLGSASIGLQFGGEKAEVIFMVMTQKGTNAFLSNKLQLGADARVAAGPVGAGAQAATADVFAFSRSKGLFGGVSGEGTVVAVSDRLNNAYYGQPVSPVQILVERTVSNPEAAKLIEVVTESVAATKQRGGEQGPPAQR